MMIVAMTIKLIVENDVSKCPLEETLRRCFREKLVSKVCFTQKQKVFSARINKEYQQKEAWTSEPD